jgi:hypothetical protein
MLLQMASAPPWPSAEQGEAPRAPKRPDYVVEYLRAGDAGRASLQAFIADGFFTSYGAQVRHFCDTLIGCRDADGQWIAGLGYSLGSDGPLFLEQYLDAPLEQEIGARAGHVVERHQVVEVGNLAAGHAGAARALIVSMTRLLHGHGLHWVAFTATASLLNSFTRLRLKPSVLAEADPRRLPDAGQHWGSYYNTQPQVMFGDIRYGYAQLA